MKNRYERTKYDGIFKDTRSHILYLRETIHRLDEEGRIVARWVERSLRTRAITVASERARLIRLKESQSPLPRSAEHSFDEIFDRILQDQSLKARATYDQARFIIDGHLRDWFKANCPSLREFQKRYEDVWTGYRSAQGSLGERRLEHDRRYLIMALRRAANLGWVERRFNKQDLTLNEPKERIGKALTREELVRLIRAAQKYPKLNLQILMAAFMGMRISEILHLQVDEVDLKRREINLRAHRIKTRKAREKAIPIPDRIYPLLAQACQDAQGAYVFPAWDTNLPGKPVNWNKPQDDNRYHWTIVRREAGLKLRFHDLRHTAITNLLKNGVPDFVVRQICGVSESTMRDIYAHLDEESKNKFRSALLEIYVE